MLVCYEEASSVMKKPLAVIFGKPVAANESELEFESDIVFRWIKAAERRCASAIWAGAAPIWRTQVQKRHRASKRV
jgi:hypothetical protein